MGWMMSFKMAKKILPNLAALRRVYFKRVHDHRKLLHQSPTIPGFNLMVLLYEGRESMWVKTLFQEWGNLRLANKQNLAQNSVSLQMQ